ncbi:MAG: heavy metal translocating P-type ATPase [Pyrobaculum sp.]
MLKFREGRSTVLKILGMHCVACSLTVQRALLSVGGVRWVEVSLASGEARVIVDSTFVNYGELAKAIRKAGYDVYREAVYIYLKPGDVEAGAKALAKWGVFSISPGNGVVYVEYNPLEIDVELLVRSLREAGVEVVKVSREEALDVDRRVAEGEARELAKRLAVAIPPTVVLGASMLTHAIPAILQLALAAVVQFYSGWGILAGAYRAFRNKAANMDTLVALGTLSTFLYSTYAVFTDGHVFFEASAFVITFVLAGRYLESRMRYKTGRAVEMLAKLQPPRARVKVGDSWLETDASSVEPGQYVEVREGERAPVDGYVEEGFGYVDEAPFTGEPIPVEKKRGDFVLAGTTLVRGRLVVRTTRSGRHTYLAEVVKLVRQAQSARLPIQNFVDKVAGVFTWFVIAVALATFAGWVSAGFSLATALSFAAAVLVVACPCALGLATPLAVVAGVGRAAELGILIKQPEALERASRARYVVFDKTGTLTYGAARVVKFVGEREALRLAAAAESKSPHPVAQSIVQYAREVGVEPAEPERFESFPGMGVYAVVEGRSVAVGNEKIVEAMGVSLSPHLKKLADEWRTEGNVVVYVVVEREVVGVAAVGDQLRREAEELIEALKRRGLVPVILSGDAERTVAAVAKALGVEEYYAEAPPERKAEVIKEIKKRGPVIFVGDGVNDAPALAVADVGIAVTNSTEAAREVGDVVVLRGDLKKVVELVDLARATLKTARFNLLWAFLYNIILIPIAAGLFYPPLRLEPELAGLAMALSSISVTLNSLRLAHISV